ncbi:beta-propeller fold lactonase family protein [Anthocerotibacter panamensis]|uniref:hypothetical protein n=1 Tax=Anthocerotibacter panamensis TaxID=2857077 RepID=UPI001C4043DE|nr:hypothetical protein [Anthocerotibacter panamensis]
MSTLHSHRFFVWGSWLVGLVGLLGFYPSPAHAQTGAEGFKVTHTLKVGRAPHGIRFSPDGLRAYVALSGDDKIAVLDLKTLKVTQKLPAGKTPLDLVPLDEADTWAITQFRGDTVVGRRYQGKDATLGPWSVGKGPSLFSPQVVKGRAYLVSEFADQFSVLDTRTGAVVARFPTGKRPYPADVTPDGVLAFVPNRADGTVTVLDLLNQKVAATPKVCAGPRGGGLTPDGISYVVACSDSGELVYLNTASYEVVARVRAGVGPKPFSVAMTPDGRYGLVNNTGGKTLSILDVAARKIVGAIAVGAQPIVVRMHPDGKRALVSCEGSGTVHILTLPPPPPPITPARKNEVIVLGTIHSNHLTSTRYSLEVLRKLIQQIRPDYVLAEIPPNRFERALMDFQTKGTIEEPRVKIFPEYVDVLFPLTKTLSFTIVPTAGWNEAMNTFRNTALERLSKDPARREDWAAYLAGNQKSAAALAARQGDDDPYFIHTDQFDALTEIGLEPYNRLFNNDLGTGGWDTINRAHYGNIARTLDAHQGEGKRFLITYGSAHKGWFLRELRQRQDITLLEVAPFLDQITQKAG